MLAGEQGLGLGASLGGFRNKGGLEGGRGEKGPGELRGVPGGAQGQHLLSQSGMRSKQGV